MKTSLQEIEVKAVEVKLNISIFEQESQGFFGSDRGKKSKKEKKSLRNRTRILARMPNNWKRIKEKKKGKVPQ